MSELYRIEFTLSGLPRRTNNAHKSWRARHAEAKKWKQKILKCFESHWRWEAASQHYISPAGGPLKKAKLTLTRFSSVEPDYDGLVSSFKHVIDGLIAARIIENDKMENIGIPEYRWEKTSPRKGFVRVVVEEVA